MNEIVLTDEEKELGRKLMATLNNKLKLNSKEPTVAELFELAQDSFGIFNDTSSLKFSDFHKLGVSPASLFMKIMAAMGTNIFDCFEDAISLDTFPDSSARWIKGDLVIPPHITSIEEDVLDGFDITSLTITNPDTKLIAVNLTSCDQLTQITMPYGMLPQLTDLMVTGNVKINWTGDVDINDALKAGKDLFEYAVYPSSGVNGADIIKELGNPIQFDFDEHFTNVNGSLPTGATDEFLFYVTFEIGPEDVENIDFEDANEDDGVIYFEGCTLENYLVPSIGFAFYVTFTLSKSKCTDEQWNQIKEEFL